MTEVKQERRATTRPATMKRKPTIDMFLECPHCRHPRHEYVYSLYDKPWIMCEECQHLSTSGAWKVIAVGNTIR